MFLEKLGGFLEICFFQARNMMLRTSHGVLEVIASKLSALVSDEAVAYKASSSFKKLRTIVSRSFISFQLFSILQ